MLSAGSLIIAVSSGLQGPADPFFGGRFIAIILSLIPSPVRRRLIKSRSLKTALQPFANQFTGSCFDGSLIMLFKPVPEPTT